MALNINGTTGISGVDGSVSAPAVTGTDSNTGITFPSADTIKFATGGVERMSITDSGVTGTGIGAGKILQVVSTTKTDTFSEQVAGGAFSADAITVSITPSNASNKIFITCFINMGCQNAVEGKFQIFKAGSVLTGATGDASGTNTRVTAMSDAVDGTGQQTNVAGQFLDTAGGTSAITYSIRLGHGSTGTKTIYLNRSHGNTSGTADSRATTTITVMEVAA